MIWDVFVSYSRNDMIIADKICQSLQNSNLKIFIDRTCIPPGVNYESYLKHAIRKSKVFLFIASKNSWESVWGLKELREFLDCCDISRLLILRIDFFPIPKTELEYIDGIANLYDFKNLDLSIIAKEIEHICNDITITETSDETLTFSTQKAFISHSSCENELAEELYSFMRGNGIDCWIDLHDIPPGMPYAKAITEGLQKCQSIIVIYSRNILNSENVLNELEIAHNSNMRIIPFLIDETPIIGEFKYYLLRRQWVIAEKDLYKSFEIILKSFL